VEVLRVRWAQYCRPFAGRATLPLIAALLAAGVSWAGDAQGRGRARAARRLNGNAEAHLRYVRSSGSSLVEEGPVSGGISGQLHAVLHVGATFSGSFTFQTRAGEINGHGSARPHGSGRYESFSGSEVVTGGTGRYTHAHGRGSMYGTFDRRTYDVTIQTRGTLYY
jgi:hypothetical protein